MGKSISEGDIEEFENNCRRAFEAVDALQKQLSMGGGQMHFLGMELLVRSTQLRGTSDAIRHAIVADLHHRLLNHEGTFCLCDPCRSWMMKMADHERREG